MAAPYLGYIIAVYDNRVEITSPGMRSPGTGVY